MDDREVLRRVIEGFKLIPAKQGFGHPYTTKHGKATPALMNRINTWIAKNFPQSDIRVTLEKTYNTLIFYRKQS